MGRIGWIAAAVLGGVAVAGIAYAASGGAATSGTNPSNTFTLAAGAQQINAKAGQQVTLQLPTGASWTSLTTTIAGVTQPAAGTKGTVTFTAPAAGTYAISASWTDAGGLPTGAVIGLTVS